MSTHRIARVFLFIHQCRIQKKGIYDVRMYFQNAIAFGEKNNDLKVCNWHRDGWRVGLLWTGLNNNFNAHQWDRGGQNVSTYGHANEASVRFFFWWQLQFCVNLENQRNESAINEKRMNIWLFIIHDHGVYAQYSIVVSKQL